MLQMVLFIQQIPHFNEQMGCHINHNMTDNTTNSVMQLHNKLIIIIFTIKVN